MSEGLTYDEVIGKVLKAFRAIGRVTASAYPASVVRVGADTNVLKKSKDRKKVTPNIKN